MKKEKTCLEKINLQLKNKFKNNLYFKEIKLIDDISGLTVEMNGILPALENRSKRNDLTQYEIEDKLKRRVAEFLGFVPKISKNY